MEAVDLFGFADAEVESESALRVVAAAAHHFGHLFPAACLYGAAGADRAAIRAHPGQFDRDRILTGALVFQQRGTVVHVDDENLRPAVAVKVPGGQPAGRPRRREPGSRRRSDVCECSVAEITIEKRFLAIGFSYGRAVDFGIEVAIGDHEVGPAVLVGVQEGEAPAEQKIAAEAGPFRNVFEKFPVLVAVERRPVAGKIGLGNVEEAVAVIIRDGDSHAGLKPSIVVVGDPGRAAALFERAVVPVAIEKARRLVAGDVDVGPAVVIEVGGGDAEPYRPPGARMPPFSETSVNVPSRLLW